MPIDCKCIECGKEFKLKPYAVKRGRGKFCEKICQYKWMSRNSKGKNNPNYGNSWSEDKKLQFAESRKGERNPFYKGEISDEYRHEIELMEEGKRIEKEKTRKRLRELKMLYKPTDEALRLISEANIGRKLSIEHCKKIGDFRRGKPLSKETREKLSVCHRGEKSHTWKGGISFLPYCPKFDRHRKRAVRDFFGVCICCGEKDYKWALSVHHIDHNKDQGCNGIPFNLVPLCASCHGKEMYREEEYKSYINKTLLNGFKWGIWNEEEYRKKVMY